MLHQAKIEHFIEILLRNNVSSHFTSVLGIFGKLVRFKQNDITLHYGKNKLFTVYACNVVKRIFCFQNSAIQMKLLIANHFRD